MLWEHLYFYTTEDLGSFWDQLSSYGLSCIICGCSHFVVGMHILGLCGGQMLRCPPPMPASQSNVPHQCPPKLYSCGSVWSVEPAQEIVCPSESRLWKTAVSDLDVLLLGNSLRPLPPGKACCHVRRTLGHLWRASHGKEQRSMAKRQGRREACQQAHAWAWQLML